MMTTRIKLTRMVRDRNDPFVLDLISRKDTAILTYGYIPLEIEVTKPQIVTPKPARLYAPRLWVLDGSQEAVNYANEHLMPLETYLVDYQDLVKTDGFRGTSYYTQLYIYEWWSDYGCDGHTEYILQGYFLSYGRIDPPATVRLIGDMAEHYSYQENKEKR